MWVCGSAKPQSLAICDFFCDASHVLFELLKRFWKGINGTKRYQIPPNIQVWFKTLENVNSYSNPCLSLHIHCSAFRYTPGYILQGSLVCREPKTIRSNPKIVTLLGRDKGFFRSEITGRRVRKLPCDLVLDSFWTIPLYVGNRKKSETFAMSKTKIPADTRHDFRFPGQEFGISRISKHFEGTRLEQLNCPKFLSCKIKEMHGCTHTHIL